MRAFKAFLLAAAVLALPSPAPAAGPGPTAEEPRSETMEKNGLDAAYFAGGCFWCTESDFEKVPGVREVISGYAGGSRPNPTYEDVSAGKTGHLESVKVVFDPREVSYKELLDWFWRHVDPTDPEGSFVDRGRQYASAIFYANETQKMAAEASKKVLMESKAFDKPIVTTIRPLEGFYPAEDYHQDFHKTHPIRYKFYRWNSGRDQFLEKIWGKAKDKP